MALFSENANDTFGFLGIKRKPNTHSIEGQPGGYSVGNDLSAQPQGNKPDISDQPGLNPIRRHSIDARSKVSGYLGEKLQQQKTEVYDSDEESSINPYDAYVNQSKLGLSLDERRDKSNWYHGETRTSDKKYDIERKYDDSIDARSNPHRNPMTTELGKANNDFNEFKKNYTTALGKLNIKTETAILNNIKPPEVIAALASGKASAQGMQQIIEESRNPGEQKMNITEAGGNQKEVEKQNARDKMYYEQLASKYDEGYKNSSEHLSTKKIPNYSSSDQSLRIDGFNTHTVEPNNITNQWKYRNEDLIPLYFHDLVNKKFIPFRSFINSLSEGSNAQWSEVQYLGRADKVYTYAGFTRTLTLDFTCQSFGIEELHPMWQRINYLVGLTKPASYTSSTSLSAMDSFIIPPFVKFRLGDMYRNQPVIITDVGTSVPTEASWELVNNEHGRDNNYDYLNGTIKRQNVRSAQYPTMVTISVSMTLLEKRAPQTISRHFGDSTVESIHDTEDNSLPRGDFNHQLIHYDSKPPIDPSLVEKQGRESDSPVSPTDQLNSERRSPSEDAVDTFSKLKSKFEILADN